jgi:hypothetical protein
MVGVYAMVARSNDHDAIEDQWEAEFIRTHPNVTFVDPEEGMRILTGQTQKILGMNGEEFLERLRNRNFPEDTDPEMIIRLAMLAHLAE